MPRDKADALEEEDASRGMTLRVPCLTKVDERSIRRHLREDHCFWLDLSTPSQADVERLGELLDLHPLALEGTLHFGQRPKLDDFGAYVFLVFYGAGERGEDHAALREVHLYVSGKYLVTVQRDQLPALAKQRSEIEGRVIHSEQFVVYRMLDALTDRFFPPLEAIDDQIDQLEDSIIAEPTDEELQRIFQWTPPATCSRARWTRTSRPSPIARTK
jgi:magnesium transporter